MREFRGGAKNTLFFNTVWGKLGPSAIRAWGVG